jgi:phosphoribosylglycinamide formyltransferase-1
VVPLLSGDTADTLAARVLTQEHLIYPQAVAQLLRKMQLPAMAATRYGSA